MNRTESRNYFAQIAQDLRIGAIDINDPQRAEKLLGERAVRKELLADAKKDPQFDAARTVLRYHARPIGEAGRYFQRLKRDLSTAGEDDTLRAEYLEAERATVTYQTALSILTESGRPNPEPKTSIRNIPETIKVEETVSDRTHEDKSENQETIRWAYSVLEGYIDAIPQKGSKKVKIEAASAYVRGALGEILHDPDKLETSFGVWKARAGESSFFRSAREKLPREVGRAWRDISPDVLKEVVIKYSRKGYVAKEFESYLTGYFESPKPLEDRVEAYYRFADALVGLIDDPEALRMGVTIGNFDSDVMSLRSNTFQDLMIATGVGVYDPETHGKANVASRLAMSSLSRLVGIDRDETMARFSDAVTNLMTDPGFKNKAMRAKRRSSREAPSEMIKLVNDTMPTYGKVFGGSILPSDGYRKIVSGEIDEDAALLIADDSQKLFEDPLGQKIAKKVMSRATAMQHRKYVTEEIQSKGEDVIFVRKHVQGVLVEVGIPASIAGNKQEILDHWSKDQEAIDILKNNETGFLPLDATFDGIPVYLTYRKLDESEQGQRHPLEALNMIGFPIVDSEDLSAENAALATQIVNEQRRFMNTRGFSVPLTHPSLADMGYQNVTFRKNPEDKRVTDVTIRVRNQDISVRMDQDFRFDFEDKACDLPIIGESLHNVLLTVLHPALCGVSIKDNEGRETDLSKIFQTRVGYIGYLGLGRNFSDEKAQEFFDVEGKDLATVSEQRKQTDPTGKERNSSYWAPVESDDPNLPPVRLLIAIPDDKFARSTTMGEKSLSQNSATETHVVVEEDIFVADREPNVGESVRKMIGDQESEPSAEVGEKKINKKTK